MGTNWSSKSDMSDIFGNENLSGGFPFIKRITIIFLQYLKKLSACSPNENEQSYPILEPLLELMF